MVGFDREFANPDLPYPCVMLDISRPEQVEAVCRQQLAENPRLDVLVNAAGILRMGNTEDLSVDDWHQCINVNASGRSTCSAPCCRTSRRSAAGDRQHWFQCRARTARADGGLLRLQGGADQPEPLCGVDGAPFGVRCNLVSPGSTDTPMQRGMCRPTTRSNAPSPVSPRCSLGIPLGKIARPDEIANAVLFPASDLASHITMQDIVIDGGATLAA